MPNVALFIVGAGIAAGLYTATRWFKAQLVHRAKKAEARKRMTPNAMASVSVRAKNLGPLVWDETAKVYKPTDRA